jgi:23S rRNA (uracil1939-C5)-methyltransferase
MEQLEITLNGMAYPGKAFGRDDGGRMVFVAFGLPGEKVLVKIEKSHKRWAEAQLLEILEPSPERISPKCPHYQECGGCHYQHLPYARQLEVKAEIVASQLERIGGILDPPVSPTIPSPMQWNYRNNLQFSLDHESRLGFHALQSDRVIPIKECHLPSADLMDLWPRITLTENPGLQRISVRSGMNGERMVVFHSDGIPDFDLQVDLPASVVWLSDDGMLVLAGEGYLVIEALDRPFRVSAGSFFQVNNSVTGDLLQEAISLLDPQPEDVILDLYAGVGLFSAFIAERGARLIAVEESAWAAEDFSINLDEFDTVELYESSVEDALPLLPAQANKVFVDPPRAGMDRKVIENLRNLSPERLVYVSCDPATLSRDAKLILESGYNLEKVTPIDLFPQTYHIETVSLFRKTAT